MSRFGLDALFPQHAGSSDRDVIAACLRGDQQAWQLLVERYQRLVYSIPRKFGLDAEDAAEIFSAVFVDLWRSLDRLEDPDQVRYWLGTVARRRSQARRQERARWITMAELGGEEWQEPADPTPSGDPILIEAEREHFMREAIAALGQRCRSLIEWLFYSDPAPSYEQMARRLGVARNSIGFLRSRCLEKLREAYLARQGADKTAQPGKGERP